NIIYSRTVSSYNDSIIIRNEILKLLIKRSTKFISLSIPKNYQLHHISGIKYCFSELESFYCDMNANRDTLEGLARICKSVKKLMFNNSFGYCIGNFRIIKFIKVQKNLISVQFNYHCGINNSFRESLEESLIKHTDTIQYLSMDW